MVSLVSEKDGVVRFSVSVPRSLLESFDAFIRGLNYSRSRAIQEAMRIFMSEHSWRYREGDIIFGAINVLYDHETRGLEEALTDIQHTFKDIIYSALHVHVDERNCMLVITVRGESSRVKKMIDEIAGRKGIKQLKVVAFTT